MQGGRFLGKEHGESSQGTERNLGGHAEGSSGVGDECTEGLPPGIPDGLMGTLCFGCTTHGGGLDSRSRYSTECRYSFWAKHLSCGSFSRQT